MAQVQGHSIDEQWDLSVQFETLVEHAVYQTVETYLALTTRGTLTAADAPGLGDTSTSVYTLWQKQVDDSLGPFIHATFQSASLNVAHDVLNVSDLPAGVGVPGVTDDFTAAYVAQVKNKMVGVGDDLWNEINLELQKGVAANEGIEELADRVRVAGATTTTRANAVARTTVLQASNAGSLSQALLLGDSGVTKEWLATEDMRTRPTHAHADGQKRSLDEAFDIGGFPLQYPGDPAGPAGEVINCRCTLVYNFDSPPTHVCDCLGTSAEALAAASYLTPPVSVPSSTCVCPVTASLTPTGYTSPISGYGPMAQQGIYQQFQKPSKISPAYGGAKIHKQLEPIKTALGLTDADTEALLDLIDQQYALAGGKSSFKQKYEEWLNSAAGKKVVKIPVSVKPVTPSIVVPPAAPVIDVDKLMASFTTSDHITLQSVIKDITGDLSLGKDFNALWSNKQIFLKVLPHFKTLTEQERLDLIKAYAHKTKMNVAAWPDTLGGTTTMTTTGTFDASAKLASLEPDLDVYAHKILSNMVDDIDYKLSKGKSWTDIWSTFQPTLKGVKGFDVLTEDEQLAVLKAYANKHVSHVPTDFWPDTASGLPAVSPAVVPIVSSPTYSSIEPGLLTAEKTKLHHLAQDMEFQLDVLGTSFEDAWKVIGHKLADIPAIDALPIDDQIKVFKDFTGTHTSVNVSKWPDSLPPTTPTIVTPATVTTPATVDLLDISTVTDAQVKELAAKFKAVKPVTPNWGGSAVMKTLQETKKVLGPDFAKFNDGQLLKMLDQGAAAGKTGKTFFGEAETWLKTPAGKKYAADAGLPGLPTPGLTTTTVTVAPAGAPATGTLGDISGIDAATQKSVFTKFKGHGTYLSSPPSKMWDTLQLLKKDPNFQHLTDLQLIRVVDAVGAQNLGVANANLYETKLVKWMKTKPGKDHIAGIVKPSTVTAPSTPAGHAPVNLASIPRNISSTDTVFPGLSNTEAQAMQSGQTAWTAGQRASLRYYTGSNYTAMNTALRKNQSVSSTLAGHIHNAQAGMRPSTRPMRLFRGTGASQLGLPSGATLADYQTLVGKTMEDKGFMSTSTNVHASFSGSVKLDIEAPTGSPMAFVKSISHYSSEDEMLLAAGTRYRVLSVTQTGHYVTLKVRIVP